MHPQVHAIFLRELQHINAASDPEELHQDHGEHASSSTLNLRIGALFMILVGGLLGVIPPICGKWLTANPDSTGARALRAFSGGTILALALVHIIPEGYSDLGGLMTYPIAGIPVVFGLLILVFLDYLMSYLMAGRQLARAGLMTPAHTTTTQGAKGKDGHDVQEQPQLPANLHACCPVSASSSTGAVNTVHGDNTVTAHAEQSSVVITTAESVGVSATGVSPFSHSHHHLPACQISTMKHYIACYTMELGCVFHSVIIGVGIGVLVDEPTLVLTLAAVMVFHQAIEGLALGSVLARTQLPAYKKVVMAVVYALCLPVGIAIGIKASETYDAESVTSKAVQGVLNSVSGGMLLYVSMYHLIGEEFSKHDLLFKPRLAGLLMVMVMLGVGCMCIIGIWG